MKPGYVKAPQFELPLDAFNLAGEAGLDGEARQRELDAIAAAEQAAAAKIKREQRELF